MPIMDGLTCTRRIRDLQREGKIIGHIPIIAVTANTRLEQIEVAVDAGMVGIILISDVRLLTLSRMILLGLFCSSYLAGCCVQSC